MDKPFEYFIVPASEISKNGREGHQKWLGIPGKKGVAHRDRNVRTIDLPQYKSCSGWEISKYQGRRSIIEELLK